MPKFPNIKVKLVETDGNAFALMGKVVAAMRKHNLPKEEVDAFTKAAMSGDYNNLLRVCCETVEVT